MQPVISASVPMQGGCRQEEELTCGALEAGLSRLPCGSCRGSRQLSGVQCAL